jgi:hypothetical protein
VPAGDIIAVLAKTSVPPYGSVPMVAGLGYKMKSISW